MWDGLDVEGHDEKADLMTVLYKQHVIASRWRRDVDGVYGAMRTSIR